MTWPDDDLRRIRRSRLLSVAPQRKDGTPGPFVLVGFAIAGNNLYVRSMSAAGLWYRRALANGVGRIKVGRTEYDVTFHDAAAEDHTPIDAGYVKKYWMAGRRMIGTMTNDSAHALTIRIDPR